MARPVFAGSAWRRTALGLALAAGFIAGCGGPSRLPVYPARGQLTIGGKPAAGVFVALHPTPDPGQDAMRPFATTREDGTFTLTTYEVEDGAPAGEYVVTLLYEPSNSPLMKKKPPRPPRIDDVYLSATTSKLRATVRAAPSNEVTLQVP